jgi:hypothetical protein
MKCIDILFFLNQLHAVHEPTVYDLEARVDVFDSKLVEYVKEFPDK